MKKILSFLFLLSFSAYAEGPLQLRSISSFVDGVAKGQEYDRQRLDIASRYTLSRRNVIGGNFGLTNVNFPSNSAYSSGMTLSSAEVFHRYRFYDGTKNYFTLQNLVNTPDLARNIVNSNANKWEYEARLLIGHNFKESLTGSIVNASTPYFVRFELGYRKRFDNPFDAIRYQLLAAVKISRMNYLYLQHNINWNMQTSGVNAANNTLSDFNISQTAMHTVQLSVMQRLSKKATLQVGYYKKIGGNAGIYDSQGIIIGLWTLIGS